MGWLLRVKGSGNRPLAKTAMADPKRRQVELRPRSPARNLPQMMLEEPAESARLMLIPQQKKAAARITERPLGCGLIVKGELARRETYSPCGHEPAEAQAQEHEGCPAVRHIAHRRGGRAALVDRDVGYGSLADPEVV